MEYSGTEPIIFPQTPIPNYDKAVRDLNAHDMRGVMVEATGEFMSVTVGMRGIVYETYDDYETDGEYGWSVIFESRSYDGFSFRDRYGAAFFEIIGIYPPAQNYNFENVMQLEKDFLAGKFKFK